MFKRLNNKIYVLDLGKEKKEIIHTFFCLESFDIALLNEKKGIVGFYENVKPFRIIFPKNKFRYVVEGKNLKNKIKEILDSF